jgi:Protein of unknown function (DUF3592)
MADAVGFAFRLFKYIFLSIGLLLLAGASYLYVDTRSWLARSIEAQGEVIEMVAVRDRESGNILYAPRVRFETRDGKTIEFQSSLRTSPPAYRAGQMVRVLYDPKDPNSAALAGFFSLWFVVMVLGFLGTVFTAIGIAAVVIGRRAQRPG